MSMSVIMPTARHDYSIINQPTLHYLIPTMKSLAKQSFMDFELIIVDGLYGRDREYDFSQLNFPVKHVPVHPDHRFWYDRKRWAVCAYLNTALLHVEGEFVVRIDDCSEFDSDFLKRFWEGYQSDVWPLAMHIRYLGGKPARFDDQYRREGYEAKYSEMHEKDRFKVLERLYGEEGVVRDTRYPVVKKAGGRMYAPHNWMYGYSSFTLEAALKINGFDELFDGDKSLEDVDFGARLEMAGYKKLWLLDVDHQVIEHEHEPIPEELIERDLKPIKCNYAIYLLNRTKKRIVANQNRLTDEELEGIIEESLKIPCSPKPNFYEDDCRGELFKLWAGEQPNFNLREERMDI